MDARKCGRMEAKYVHTSILPDIHTRTEHASSYERVGMSRVDVSETRPHARTQIFCLRHSPGARKKLGLKCVHPSRREGGEVPQEGDGHVVPRCENEAEGANEDGRAEGA
jgi:hypothetical protein